MEETPEVVVWGIHLLRWESQVAVWTGEGQDMKHWSFTHQVSSLRIFWGNIHDNILGFLLQHDGNTSPKLSWRVTGKSFFLCPFSIILGYGTFSLYPASLWSHIWCKIPAEYLLLFAQVCINGLVESDYVLLRWFLLFCVSSCSVFNSVCIDSIKKKQMSWESFR